MKTFQQHLKEDPCWSGYKQIGMKKKKGKKVPNCVPEESNCNCFSHELAEAEYQGCLLYTSPSPRDGLLSRMPSSA